MEREIPDGEPVTHGGMSGRVPLAVVVVDGDGLVSHWSTGARRLFVTIPEPFEAGQAVFHAYLALAEEDAGLHRAVEQIAGLQTQYAPSGYVGLWTRVAGFERAAVPLGAELKVFGVEEVVGGKVDGILPPAGGGSAVAGVGDGPADGEGVGGEGRVVGLHRGDSQVGQRLSDGDGGGWGKVVVQAAILELPSGGVDDVEEEVVAGWQVWESQITTRIGLD